MELIAVKGARTTRVRPTREQRIYALLKSNPELLDKDTQVRVLYVNTGPEKGPDFLAVNKRGHLLLGQLKRGALPWSAWPQAKQYAKRFRKMGIKELDDELREAGLKTGFQRATRGFLGSKALRTVSYPSRRKLQLIFVAEHFSDRILRSVTRDALGAILRSNVNDVKCVELRTYRVRGRSTIAVASVISGKRRRLRR